MLVEGNSQLQGVGKLKAALFAACANLYGVNTPALAEFIPEGKFRKSKAQSTVPSTDVSHSEHKKTDAPSRKSLTSCSGDQEQTVTRLS